MNIANCKVGDETATINARITGDNAKIMVEGATLAFRNGRSEMRRKFDKEGGKELKTGG